MIINIGINIHSANGLELNLKGLRTTKSKEVRGEEKRCPYIGGVGTHLSSKTWNHMATK